MQKVVKVGRFWRKAKPVYNTPEPEQFHVLNKTCGPAQLSNPMRIKNLFSRWKASKLEFQFKGGASSCHVCYTKVTPKQSTRISWKMWKGAEKRYSPGSKWKLAEIFKVLLIRLIIGVSTVQFGSKNKLNVSLSAMGRWYLSPAPLIDCDICVCFQNSEMTQIFPLVKQ